MKDRRFIAKNISWLGVCVSVRLLRVGALALLGRRGTVVEVLIEVDLLALAPRRGDVRSEVLGGGEVDLVRVEGRLERDRLALLAILRSSG